MRIINNEKKWEIILIEDDTVVISLIEKALSFVEEKSYLVSFSDGESVLDYLEKKSQDDPGFPDLLLINLYCSGKKNHGFIQMWKACEERKRIPVIAMGNPASSIKPRDIYDMKVNCYMIKPEDQKDLFCYMQTTFLFWLNIVRLTTGPQMTDSDINCDTAGRSKRPEEYSLSGKAEVLLVEDNPGDVRLTREALIDSGFQCDLNVFSNGADALNFLHGRKDEKAGVLPDIILLDLNLPRMDGREVLAIIKSSHEFRHIPVFILTTSANEKDIEQAYDLHANCYILKPLDMDQCVSIFQCLKLFWFYTAVLPKKRI